MYSQGSGVAATECEVREAYRDLRRRMTGSLMNVSGDLLYVTGSFSAKSMRVTQQRGLDAGGSMLLKNPNGA